MSLRSGISGIIASTVLASAAMIINYLGSSGATVFTTLVLMTGITAAIPYGFTALAQLKWRWIDHRTLETPRFARDMIVAILSLVFSILFICYSRNSGHSFWVCVGGGTPSRQQGLPACPPAANLASQYATPWVQAGAVYRVFLG